MSEPVTAPAAPGRLGEAASPPELLAYLQALAAWVAGRDAELRALDEEALAAGEDAHTADLALSLALWKAVADRLTELERVWDSGRAGRRERETMASLVWGRTIAADARPPAGRGRSSGAVGGAGAGGLSLPEACRLSDALAASLAAALAADPFDATVAARLRTVRHAVERLRDAGADAALLAQLDAGLAQAQSRAARGADATGVLARLEGETARAERDLIVAGARRREAGRRAVEASATRARLRSREAALRDLAARCAAAVSPPPRLAVPRVEALGAVPSDPDALDAYLARLERVAQALDVAERAWAAPLAEREELAGLLEAYAAKARATGWDAAPGVRAAAAAAAAALATAPTPLPALREAVAAYRAALAPATAAATTTATTTAAAPAPAPTPAPGGTP